MNGKILPNLAYIFIMLCIEFVGLIAQKPDMAGLAEFLKPLNEVIMKANAMTEGRRSDFFNHLKSATDSLTALAWIAYTGKDCGERNILHIFCIGEMLNSCVLDSYLAFLFYRHEHAYWTCGRKLANG